MAAYSTIDFNDENGVRQNVESFSDKGHMCVAEKSHFLQSYCHQLQIELLRFDRKFSLFSISNYPFALTENEYEWRRMNKNKRVSGAFKSDQMKDCQI